MLNASSQLVYHRHCPTLSHACLGHASAPVSFGRDGQQQRQLESDKPVLQLLDEAQEVRGLIVDPREQREELQRAAENLDARQDDAARHNRHSLALCQALKPAP